MYKTSFQKLEIEVRGVYSVYNLTPEELKSFNLRFHGKINGSGSNYTAFENASRKVWLKLFVHGCWLPIKIDIREDLLRLTNSNKIFNETVEKLSKTLKSNRVCIWVDYNIITNTWDFVSKEEFLKELSEILKTF